MTQAQSLCTLAEASRQAQQAGTAVNVSLSCAFGWPMEGEVPAATVLDWTRQFADLGGQRLTLCETTGMADPGQVLALCSAVQAAQAVYQGLEFTAHFHDTRSLGGANVFAALQAGITRFDASLGGIGGCPYAPGASGKFATEDVVHLLTCLGFECGLTVAGLAGASAQLSALLGRELIPYATRRHAWPAMTST